MEGLWAAARTRLGMDRRSFLAVSPRELDAWFEQIELCDRHAEVVIARERVFGLEILDRRNWR